MVPAGTGDVGGSAANSSKVGRYSSELTKRTTPLSHSGALDTSRMAYIRGSCRIKDFQKGLPPSYVPPGEMGQRNHTIQPGDDGFAGVVQGKSIQFLPPW